MELTIKHTHMTRSETHTSDTFGPESKTLSGLHLSSAKRSFTEQLPEECGEKQSNPIINMFLWEESSLPPPPCAYLDAEF